MIMTASLLPKQCLLVECRFREVQALREMKFNFADRPSSQGYAQGIASTMQLVPGPYTLLALHNVPLDYDETAICQVLEELQPEGVQCMWCSTSFVVRPSTCCSSPCA